MSNIEHKFLEIFLSGSTILGEGFPATINGVRAGFMEDFMLLGLPTTHDERFLRSDIKGLFEAEEREIFLTAPKMGGPIFRDVSGNDPKNLSFVSIPGANTIVFENGFPVTQASKLPYGVFCGPLKAIFSADVPRGTFEVNETPGALRRMSPGDNATESHLKMGLGIDTESQQQPPASESRIEIGSDDKILDISIDFSTNDDPAKAAAMHCRSQVERFYNSIADNKNDALTALNSAFMQDCAVIWVSAGVKLGEPLLLDFRFSSDEEALMCFSRSLIVLEDGAEADISVVYRDGNGSKTRFLADHVGEVIVGKGAKLRLSETAIIGPGSAICLSNYARQAAQSHMDSVFCDLGDGFSRISLNADLAEENAENILHGLYVAAGGDRADCHENLGSKQSSSQIERQNTARHFTGAHTDIELKINHLAPDCRSRQIVKGIVGQHCSTWNNLPSESDSDRSSQDKNPNKTRNAETNSAYGNGVSGGAMGSFTGMIYVAPDAQRTDAALHNRNLQLSDNVKVYTRPQLEIYADDVKCGHGASVGQLDEEAIYYMRQRGVGEAQARRMQMQGFADDIINHCQSEGFREFTASKAQLLISKF